MKRAFIFGVIAWLAAFGGAHAQLDPGANSQTGFQAGSQSSPQAGAAPAPPPVTAAPTAPPTVGATGAAPSVTLSETPCPEAGGLTAPGCASDPLYVPTWNVRTSFGASGTELAGGTSRPPGSSNGISASASIDPQAALQLPGEASNTPTQGPNTTASQPAAASTPACSASVPSTTGGSSPGQSFRRNVRRLLSLFRGRQRLRHRRAHSVCVPFDDLGEFRRA